MLIFANLAEAAGIATGVARRPRPGAAGRARHAARRARRAGPARQSVRGARAARATGRVAAAAPHPALRPGRLRGSRLDAGRPIPPRPRNRRADRGQARDGLGRRGAAAGAELAGLPPPHPRCRARDGRRRAAALLLAGGSRARTRTAAPRPGRWPRRSTRIHTPGDCGIGDFAGVAALARDAARRGAAALAISPAHALFAADPGKYGPYAPSSRLALNVLHAAPGLVPGLPHLPPSGDPEPRDGADRLAGRDAAQAGPPADAVRRRVRTPRLRRLPQRRRPPRSRTTRGSRRCTRAWSPQDPPRWNWREWPQELRTPDSPGAARFFRENAGEVAFHAFCQWLADASLGAAQRAARAGGHADRPDRGPRGRHRWRRQPRLVAAGGDPFRPLRRRAARRLLAARPGLGADGLLAAGDARRRLRRLPRIADGEPPPRRRAARRPRDGPAAAVGRAEGRRAGGGRLSALPRRRPAAAARARIAPAPRGGHRRGSRHPAGGLPRADAEGGHPRDARAVVRAGEGRRPSARRRSGPARRRR